MNVAVIYGGSSSERDVSIKTGTAVIEALRSLEMEVSAFLVDEHDIFQILPDLKKVDMVYIAFHGSLGEDGRIQAILETAGIPFVGSDSLGSRLAMEKTLSKILFERAGIPTPSWLAVRKGYSRDYVMASVSHLGLPLAVKPASEGSTFGFTKVTEHAQLLDAIDFAMTFDDEVLIETFIEGRELTVAMLAGETLPPVLIIPYEGLYDYKHKYTKGTTEYVCPAPIPDDIAQELERLADMAFKTLGCRNYGRVDFRLTDDNHPFCLEVNTLPGMTSLSLVPMAAKARGYDFPELLRRILLDALTFFK